MDFKKVSVADRPRLTEYLQNSHRPHSDNSFADIICLEHIYRHFWCEEDGFLLLKVLYPDGHAEYRQPFGDGDFTRLLPALEHDAASDGQPFILSGMTDEGVRLCREVLPQWGFSADRQAADYLYNAQDLRELRGKRYQPKRNHIHKFESEYDGYRYLNLTPALFEDCKALETEWLDVKCARGEGIPEDMLAAELSDEQKIIMRAFEHWDELGFMGGAIYVGDNMVAFTFGSPIDDKVFCTHIEKANPAYDGAFTVINREFARHLPAQYEFIDREDDAGIPGLRKAKLSYHPCFLSPRIVGRQLDAEEIRIRELWMECFPEDSPDDADAFIMNRLDRSRMLRRTVDGRIVSMLHIVPFGDAAYLYAVATSPAYRGRGMAGELCREAIERCRLEGFKTVALIPSSDSLRSWYASMGFSGDCPMSFIDADGFDFGTGSASTDRAMICKVND